MMSSILHKGLRFFEKINLLKKRDSRAKACSPISEDPILLVGGISRSGTTLLVTVLDSHPQISMGSEMIPAPFPDIETCQKNLVRALEETNSDWDKVSGHFVAAGDKVFGTFLTRCRRAGLSADEVIEVFVELHNRYPSGIQSFDECLDVAQSLVQRRWMREQTELYGFKLNNASISLASEAFPNAHFACIIRDPADVLYSQIKRGFKKSPAEILDAWSKYSQSYHQFAEQNPDKCTVLRYEDLVSSPRRTMEGVFTKLPIKIDPIIFDFYKSNSVLHHGNHPNAERLKMNFSTDKLGIGWKYLDVDTLNIVKKRCASEMERNGYAGPGFTAKKNQSKKAQKIEAISDSTVKMHSRLLAEKRKFNVDDYEALLAPYSEDYRSIRLCDYVRNGHQAGERYLLIRHDIDHDMETACKMARWEAQNGIKSTYCILHTAWYYGELKDGKYRHSKQLMDGVYELLSHGHEINFHNNLAVLSLQTGIDPFELLEQELEFFYNAGVPIVGSSTHGDAMCRELNFRNWEIFSECCDGRFGGPRILNSTDKDGNTHSIHLGQRSMTEFQLEYEAYDIARDVYHTDSGGNMRTRENTRGRRSFNREPGNGHVVGVLAHPVWWDF